MEGTEEIVNLNGEFRYKADAKGRVSLPAVFRKVLPSDLVVTLDPDGEYLMVFTNSGFNTWVEEIMKNAFGELKVNDRAQMKARRHLKSRAYGVQIDTAGRIMIPAAQMEGAGIEKDVVIVGSTGYFEMWDAKRYEADCEDFDLSSLLC